VEELGGYGGVVRRGRTEKDVLVLEIGAVEVYDGGRKGGIRGEGED